MPIFTAIGAAIFSAGTFLAGATAFVLQTAAGLGLSYLAQAVAGKKQGPEQATGPGFSVQGKLQASGDLPRSFIFGLASTAGSLVYANEWGEDGGTPNAFHTEVISLSDLPAQSLEEVWVNGEKVTVDWEATPLDQGYPVLEYRVSGKDHLWVKFYDGSQTSADAFLQAKVASAERPYGSNRKAIGISYAIVTALVNADLFSGFPAYKFTLIGCKLYDITKDTTAGGDGSQRWSYPATWGGDGDHLPAVQLYNLLRGISFDDVWLYGLQNMSAARAPAANWLAQVGKCRALIDGPDGDEATYRSGGEIRVNNETGRTIETLLLTCQGRLSEIGGFYKMHCGAPDSAVFSFTDDDILSTEDQTFRPFFGLADTINGVNAKYPSPAEGWAIKVAPPLLNPDYEEEDGGRRLMSDVSLDFVPYERQVQHLMQSALAEARRARKHTISLPPAFWLVEPGDIAEWTSERNGYDAKELRVDGMVDKANLDVMLDLTEVDPADYDWDQEADYTAPVNGPTAIVRPSAQAIVAPTFEGVVVEGSSGQRRAAVYVTWDGEVDDVRGVQIEIRREADEEVVLRHTQVEFFDAGEIYLSQNILSITEYEGRIKYLPDSDRLATWSDWIAFETPDARVDAAALDASLTAIIQRVLERIPQDLLTVRADLDALAAATNSQFTTIAERLGRVNIGVGSRYQENKAGAEIALTAATDANSALAAIFEEVFAITDEGTAESLLRIFAAAGPEGIAAQIAFLVRATADDVFAEAGFRLEAGVTELGGTSRAVVSADRFYAENPTTGDILNLSLTVEQSEPVPVAIASSEIHIDLRKRKQTYTTTLTGAAEIKFPTGATVGRNWTHYILQDGTGGRALTFDDTLLNSDELPTINDDPDAITILKGEIISIDPPQMIIYSPVSAQTVEVNDPPVVESVSTSGDNGGGTATVTLPAGIVSGDLVIIAVTCFGGDGFGSFSATGWTSLGRDTENASGTNVWTQVLYKYATGSMSSVNLTNPGGTINAHCAMRVSGAQDAPEIQFASSTSDSPNPPSITPSWGQDSNLFVVVLGNGQPPASLSSFPEGYTFDATKVQTQIQSIRTSMIHRNAFEGTQDPGPLLISSSNAWIAATIAVKPVQTV